PIRHSVPSSPLCKSVVELNQQDTACRAEWHMRDILVVARALTCVLCWGAASAEKAPQWAFFVPTEGSVSSQAALAGDGTPWQPPSASRSYTSAQLREVLNPPDWYPDEHPAMPAIVAGGSAGEVAGRRVRA